jgi:CubicO group peptidase (beta-lactamase class C family)
VKTAVLLDAVRPYIAHGEVPGAVVGVLHDDRVCIDAAGTTTTGGSTAWAADTLVRISSNTKPMAAALT